jgi:hypothetical protein
MTLLLLSPGVHAVRADDSSETTIGVEPTAETRDAAKPPVAAMAAPARDAKAPDAVEPAGPSAVEVDPDVIVLNTRGYNYGPPPDQLDPAALRDEAKTR